MTCPPHEMWDRHSAHAGISAAGFREYYAQTSTAVGILIGGVHGLPEPRRLTDLSGQSRPPQSFSYLSAVQAANLRSWLQPAPHQTQSESASLSAIATLLSRTIEAIHTTTDRLLRASRGRITSSPPGGRSRYEWSPAESTDGHRPPARALAV